jgi:hypothetical protein
MRDGEVQSWPPVAGTGILAGMTQRQTTVRRERRTSPLMAAPPPMQVHGFEDKIRWTTVVKIAGTLVGKAGQLRVLVVTHPARF